MGKNIALFVDGTGNNGLIHRFYGADTNVFKLHKLCQEPLNLYLQGVGSARGDVLGGIVGFGTKTRLRDAYRFLVSHYESGDRIFLFGFSRGALAVRLFASFLGYAGTIFGKPPYDAYLPHVYRIFESSVALNVPQDFERYMRLFAENIAPLPIHFIGVWDTVERYFPTRELKLIEEIPNHITHARQALAIHERRNEMQPTLWTKWNSRVVDGEEIPTVMQVWFPGAHSDVGGGYRESRLSEEPLAWIYSEASKVGLSLAPLPPFSDKPFKIHQQRTGGAIVGAVAHWRNGTATRSALTATQNQNVIDSFDFNLVSQQHFKLPIPDITFNGYLDAKDKQKALADLKLVDSSASALFNSLTKRKWPPIP